MGEYSSGKQEKGTSFPVTVSKAGRGPGFSLAPLPDASMLSFPQASLLGPDGQVMEVTDHTLALPSF